MRPAPRAPAVSVALVAALLASLAPSLSAQRDLEATIRDLSRWPCADPTWEDCPVVVPSGGLDGAGWYERTAWSEERGGYMVPSADGSGGTTYAGKTAFVNDTASLMRALEDRFVAEIRVVRALEPHLDVAWPEWGYPITRDVAVVADESCAKESPADPPGCVVRLGEKFGQDPQSSYLAPSGAKRNGGKTLFVVNKDGHLRMRGLRILRAGGRNGGAVFVQAGGRADFTDVGFESGEYVQRDLSAEPSAAGAAAFVVNADRPLSEAAIEAARAAVAGTTGLDHVRVTEPYNTTFTRCNFTENVVRSGGGGAVAARVVGEGWVIFDECRFVGNAAGTRGGTGRGGAVHATGNGRVIFAACTFEANVASDSGGAAFASGGGLFGGCNFTANAAEGGSGGAIFAPNVTASGPRALLVQETLFARNVAEREGGAVFVYGPGAATFRGCEFDSNAVVGAGPSVHDAATYQGRGATRPDSGTAYHCADAATCLARTAETELIYRPAYEPFAEQRDAAPVYVRPPEEEEAAAAEAATAAAPAPAPGTGTSVPPPPPPPPPPMDSAGTPPPPPASSSGGSSSPGGYAY